MLASRLASRIAFACAAPIALGAMAWSAPALAQGGPSGFERAILAQLNASTRANVEQRATGGNTVTNVVGTILLNNYYQAGAENPGQPLTVVAVDFARGNVVLRRDPNTWEVVRFDPQTLRITR
jgi:hypothetical protein